ncbi:MAG: AmmeMemoRadiSam system radical SAM enzyme [Pseudomonadota bacterium]
MNLPPIAAFQRSDGDAVRCELCPHRCLIREGRRGRCGVREVRAGTLRTLVWGRPVALNVDPIEKKPLFHFLPGETSLSIATAGCNLECRFCQNHSISQARPEERSDPLVPPSRVVEEARRTGARIIAYTYTEPTIFYEYAEDIARAAAADGLRNVFVTNGYIAEAPLRRLLPLMDGANVDLKAFSDETYRRVLGGSLEPVLRSLRILKEAEVWLEVTTLLVPGLNDSDGELDAIAGAIAALDPGIPWHVSRFHPDHRMLHEVRTPMETVERALGAGRRAGLQYVYPGNTPTHQGECTWCHGCGALLIARQGFRVSGHRCADGRCPECGVRVPGRFS